MIYEIANNRKFPKKEIYVDAPIVQQRIAEVDNDNLRVKMIDRFFRGYLIQVMNFLLI